MAASQRIKDAKTNVQKVQKSLSYLSVLKGCFPTDVWWVCCEILFWIQLNDESLPAVIFVIIQTMILTYLISIDPNRFIRNNSAYFHHGLEHCSGTTTFRCWSLKMIVCKSKYFRNHLNWGRYFGKLYNIICCFKTLNSNNNSYIYNSRPDDDNKISDCHLLLYNFNSRWVSIQF